ncbi:MAG: monovalent cation:proton antiporter-2 (CPA2) family protein [Pseudomonadales bacterium]
MLTNALIYLAAAVLAVPLFRRLGLGAVLGYVAAGVVIGPWCLALISDVDDILHFSELGVVLLLFVIGLELRPSRLWALRNSIFGFGAAQMFLTASLLAVLLVLDGYETKVAIILGLVLALSSTAFALQLLAERHELSSKMGRTAFGNLLFQDLAVIPLLALMPLLATSTGPSTFSPQDMLFPAAVLLFLAFAGRWLLRLAMRIVATTKVREIVTAMALFIVLGTAWLMEYAGLSMALGAFVAGVLLADSEFRHQLEADIEPFKGLLLGLFFIAVGMSLNLGLLAEDSQKILIAVIALVAVKAAVLYGLGRWQGLESTAARNLGIVLSQGGEFAFVLLGIAVNAHVLPAAVAEHFIVVVTLSMMTTPLLLLLVRLGQRKAEEPVFDEMPAEDPPVIIAGFGRFGQVIARVLRAKGIHFTALEIDQMQVDFVRTYGNDIYYGDASRLDLLQAAGVGSAQLFILAVDDVEASVRIAALLQKHYPQLSIYARARNRKHAYRLMDLDVKVVRRDTFLAAVDLTREVLIGTGLSEIEARNTVDAFRAHDLERLHAHAHLHSDEDKMRDLAKTAAQELEEMFAGDIVNEKVSVAELDKK